MRYRPELSEHYVTALRARVRSRIFTFKDPDTGATASLPLEMGYFLILMGRLCHRFDDYCVWMFFNDLTTDHINRHTVAERLNTLHAKREMPEGVTFEPETGKIVLALDDAEWGFLPGRLVHLYLLHEFLVEFLPELEAESEYKGFPAIIRKLLDDPPTRDAVTECGRNIEQSLYRAYRDFTPPLHFLRQVQKFTGFLAKRGRADSVQARFDFDDQDILEFWRSAAKNTDDTATNVVAFPSPHRLGTAKDGPTDRNSLIPGGFEKLVRIVNRCRIYNVIDLEGFRIQSQQAISALNTGEDDAADAKNPVNRAIDAVLGQYRRPFDFLFSGPAAEVKWFRNDASLKLVKRFVELLPLAEQLPLTELRALAFGTAQNLISGSIGNRSGEDAIRRKTFDVADYGELLAGWDAVTEELRTSLHLNLVILQRGLASEFLVTASSEPFGVPVGRLVIELTMEHKTADSRDLIPHDRDVGVLLQDIRKYFEALGEESLVEKQLATSGVEVDDLPIVPLLLQFLADESISGDPAGAEIALNVDESNKELDEIASELLLWLYGRYDRGLKRVRDTAGEKGSPLSVAICLGEKLKMPTRIGFRARNEDDLLGHRMAASQIGKAYTSMRGFGERIRALGSHAASDGEGSDSGLTNLFSKDRETFVVEFCARYLVRHDEGETS
ncbi:MAG: hypothetical protein GKS00_24700 [Alphaproteobacteria bacterium]|nr:hypothetical protein [Alphaproteobacteria bacterium]